MHEGYSYKIEGLRHGVEGLSLEIEGKLFCILQQIILTKQGSNYKYRVTETNTERFKNFTVPSI